MVSFECPQYLALGVTRYIKLRYFDIKHDFTIAKIQSSARNQRVMALTHQLPMSWSNAVFIANIPSMDLTFDIFHAGGNSGGVVGEDEE